MPPALKNRVGKAARKTGVANTVPPAAEWLCCQDAPSQGRPRQQGGENAGRLEGGDA